MPLIHVMHILVFISIGLKVSCMLLVGATTQIKGAPVRCQDIYCHHRKAKYPTCIHTTSPALRKSFTRRQIDGRSLYGQDEDK